MSELFPASEMAMDSPRLAWMKKYSVSVHHSKQCPESPWCAWFPGNEETPGGIPLDPDLCGYGTTEEDALRDLAVRNDFPLWNEEGVL